MEPDRTTDVAIVGYGPTGQTLAVLLAQRGWSVTVLEKWPQPYPMPRAVSLDAYGARVLTMAGIGAAIDEFGVPGANYVVRNGGGETLLELELGSDGRYGPPRSTSIYQPGLEDALSRRGEQLPTLTVRRGHEVVDVADHGDGASLLTRDVGSGETSTLAARWVIGCDGARSLVRDRIATTVTDLGFTIDWMACDLVPHRLADHPPVNVQVADPARPRVAATAGPRHRRWEFMRLPGESLESFNTEANAWRLLELFGIGRDQAELERYAVYRLSAVNADRWRRGRLLVAGDAAHQMPPFAGQGMCSGIADAANLAWRLDRVLSDADPELLDGYERERRPAAQRAIEASVQLGRMICLTDAVAAGHRDRAMTARHRASGAAGSAPSVAAGVLPTARVLVGGRACGVDEELGGGFTLLVRAADVLDPATGDRLRAEGVRIVRVLAPGAPAAGADTMIDSDGTLTAWFDSLGAGVVLVRPDRHVFGTAAGATELAELTDTFVARTATRLVGRA